MIRRKPRTDPVTPERALEIMRLDGGCVAPRLGGSAMDCWGRDRIEHVQEGYGRMAKRGVLLATLCEGHTEPGMRAGFVWCTNAANRQKLRDYIRDRDADHRHVEPVWGCAQCVQVDPYPASLL
jgi:hypothetical protein